MSVEENFIPWSMIEPLLEEGMTFSDLAKVIRERLGLPKGVYGVVTISPAGWSPLRDAICYGLRLVKKTDPAFLRAKTLDDEPVR